MNEQQQEQASAVRHYGKLRLWIAERGFGFVDSETAPVKDFYMHISQVDEAQHEKLEVGAFIEFTPLKKLKGWSAMNAVVLE